MKKIGRNDPCHCGSGKKYKHCHLNKKESPASPSPAKSLEHNIEEIIEQKNSVQILGILALLQLHPENHGRNFRIEQLCRQVLLQFDSNDSRPLATWDELKASIEGYTSGSYMEDPLTNAFTETVVFELGNYVVYPGMYSNFAQILSQLIDCIFIQKPVLPEIFVKKVRDAAGLLLFMSRSIAEEIGHKSDIYCIGNTGNIEFIEYETAVNNVDAVYFSNDFLDKVCTQYGYDKDILKDFIFLPSSEELAEDDPDKNVVNFKPLVHVGNSILVYMPTALLNSLITFIYEKAQESECLEILLDLLCKRQFHLSCVALTSTGWLFTNITLPVYEGKLKLREAVFQIDNQKFAYVSLVRADSLLKGSFNVSYEERAIEVVRFLGSINPEQQFHVLCLYIMAETGQDQMFALQKPSVGNQSLALSYKELLTITTAPETNSLTLWKFAKCYQRTNELTRVMSIGGAMDAYAIYRKNHGSLLDSDEANPLGGILMIPFGNADNLRREMLKYRNEHAVAAFIDGQLGFLKVSRYREYAPIYIEKEYSPGFRAVIENYKMPIWITDPQSRGSKETWGKYICEAIAFWLYRMTDILSPHINAQAFVQFEIEVIIDEHLKEAKEFEIKAVPIEAILVNSEIIAPKICINIPFDFIYATILPDNTADRILMRAVLKGFVKYIEAAKKVTQMDDAVIEQIIDSTLQPAGAKMILFSDASANIKMDDRKLPSLRYVQDTDISFVLDNLVSYLPEGYLIPEDIVDKRQKIKLCDDIVAALLLQITQKLKEFDGAGLLEWLIKSNEKCIQVKEFREISIPARIACFSDYDTELNRINNGEKNLVTTSHSVRTLIEFVATSIPTGSKWPNLDDIDELLALTNQVTEWGSLNEAIRLGLDDPRMGLLPSGRIGTDKTVGREVFTPYGIAKNESEIFKNIENFEKKYVSSRNIGPHEPTDESIALDAAFTAEFGLSLTVLSKIIGALVNEGFVRSESCLKIKENDLIEILSKIEGVTIGDIQTALNMLTLLERPALGTAPSGYTPVDIFTWRYNRSLSYLRRPLVKVVGTDGTYFYFGYRHLMQYIENLINLLFTSKLPSVKSELMKTWLAGISGQKGGPFRKEVKEWFENNTDFEVIPYEVKMDTIVTPGHLKTDKHYGDIDLLVIDHTNQTIYPIECKNITGGRNVHEMKVEMDDYLGRNGNDKKAKILKHVARHKWLKSNKSSMTGLIPEAENYSIMSFILTADEIPLTYLKGQDLPIPIRSFPFLRKNGLSYLSDL